MKVDGHKQGAPSWVGLMTSDAQAAQAFYSGLFGWSAVTMSMPDGGAYSMQQIDGDDIAGLTLLGKEQQASGIPPHWGVYLAVDDADAVVAKVAAAGGMVLMPPMDVMDIGRMAVIADPTGAAVSPWEAKSHPGFRRVNEPNTVTWCEVMTDDADRAADFFTAILDVPHEAMWARTCRPTSCWARRENSERG